MNNAKTRSPVSFNEVQSIHQSRFYVTCPYLRILLVSCSFEPCFYVNINSSINWLKRTLERVYSSAIRTTHNQYRAK